MLVEGSLGHTTHHGVFGASGGSLSHTTHHRVLGACEDPGDKPSTIGCLVLVEDPIDLPKCQQQFLGLAFGVPPKINN